MTKYEKLMEEKLEEATKADPGNVPFGLDAEQAAVWHQARQSAFQYALEMLPLHNSK